jgi:drug/metabolite transporter (DMT)-like permease
MENKLEKYKVLLVGVLFSVLVGFSFFPTKLAVGIGTSAQMVAFRFSFALIVVIFVIAAGIVKVDFKGKRIKEGLLVAVFYGGFFILQGQGLTYSSSIESGILYAIVPILVMIIASFSLKERTTWLQKLSIITVVIGVILMYAIGSGGYNISEMSPVGFLYLLASSLSMAIAAVLIRRLKDEFTSTEITVIITVVCFVVFNAICIITMAKNGNIKEYFEPLMNIKYFISVAYLGTACTYLSPMMRSYLLAKTEAAKASLCGNAATGVSIVAGVLVFREPLELYHIIGTLMIIAGITGTTIKIKSKPKEETIMSP